MYTGDDFDYPALIRGDARGHSDALLGIFDAIAPAAAAALAALDDGDLDRYEEILAPTVTLSRHVFQAPTYRYKTGVVFLAYLNGHQRHFRMVGGQEGARSVDAPGRAVRARRRGGAAARPGARGGAHARGARARGGGPGMSARPDLARLSLNQITIDQCSLPEAIDACGRAGLTVIGPWRHKVAEVGVERAAGLIRAAGLRVSSLCRGGFFPPPTRPGCGGRRRQPARGRGGGGARHRRARARLRAAGRARRRARAGADPRRHRAPRPARGGPRGAAGDRAAAPDDDLRALGDRHPRRGERPGGAVRRASRRRRRRRLPRVVGPAAVRGDRPCRAADLRLSRRRLARPHHRPAPGPRDDGRRGRSTCRGSAPRSSGPATTGRSRSR